MQPNPSSQHHVQIDPNIYLHQLPKPHGVGHPFVTLALP